MQISFSPSFLRGKGHCHSVERCMCDGSGMRENNYHPMKQCMYGWSGMYMGSICGRYFIFPGHKKCRYQGNQ